MTPELSPPIDLVLPKADAVPLLVSSPHSGQIYPPSLLAASRIGLGELRRLEDPFVDRLFGRAPHVGAWFVKARFARAYADANREAFEFDPDLFEGQLPPFVNTASAKAKAGLGTIPSRIAGQAIYRKRLAFDEAQTRIRLAYQPYHDALQQLIDTALARFNTVLLLDCHSMPTLSANGSGIVDIALGDRFGCTCGNAIIDEAERLFSNDGYRVARNRPYAGGYITTRYGEPGIGVHALQIEIRRGLYMDENAMRPHDGMAGLQAAIEKLLRRFATLMTNIAQPHDDRSRRTAAKTASDRR